MLSSCGTPDRRIDLIPRTAVLQANISSNDVLLGRGAPLMSFQGNVLFRRTVHEKYEKYLKAHEQCAKDEVAREVINIIGERGGRFLRRQSSSSTKLRKSSAEALTTTSDNAGENCVCWTVVEDNAILRKVKQAFRDLGKKDGQSDFHNGAGGSFENTIPTESSVVPATTKVGLQAPTSFEKQVPSKKETHLVCWPAPSTGATPHSLSSSWLNGLQSHVNQMEQLHEQQLAAAPLSSQTNILLSRIQQATSTITLNKYRLLAVLGHGRPLQSTHHQPDLSTFRLLDNPPWTKNGGWFDQSFAGGRIGLELPFKNKQFNDVEDKQTQFRNEVLALAQLYHKNSSLMSSTRQFSTSPNPKNSFLLGSDRSALPDGDPPPLFAARRQRECHKGLRDITDRAPPPHKKRKRTHDNSSGLSPKVLVCADSP